MPLGDVLLADMIPGLLEQWSAFRGLTAPPAEAICLWKEGGCGVWIDDAWGPAVPYPPINHGNGHRNHGYLRIKGALDLVAQIPEVADFPELSTFLIAVNSPGSPIESVGCERALSASDVESAPPVHLGAYIDVIFTDMTLNDSGENALALASEMLQSVKSCERWWANVSAVMQRFRCIPQTKAPWGLMLHVSAYGRSELEARSLWGETLGRLADSVQALPENYRWRPNTP